MRTIDEKAKAYDLIVGRAKNKLDACSSQDCDTANLVFELIPELKENGDKDILNAIAEGLQFCEKMLDWSDFGGIPINTILDWIEKHGYKI